MTTQEFNKLLLPKSQLVARLKLQYYGRLYNQLSAWLNNHNASSAIILPSIELFCDRSSMYWSNTDCYYAIVGCMHDMFLDAILRGEVEISQCTNLVKKWYERRFEIKPIPQRQMNIVISDFSRKMFDYFVDRYYLLKNIPFDARLEKKIARKFAGRGSLRVLYDINRFQKPTCTPEAYFFYAKYLDPYFIEQIGIRKPINAHPDSLQAFTLQRTVNRARYSLPVLMIMFLILLILAYLNINGILRF